MIVDDIYGSFEVEPVLQDLILSKPVQRLKGIHQGGASYLVNKEWNVSRYEHSVGVMLLIRKLGGTLQEQIAGLLHDVSHTAFSHVIDFVLDNESEDFHEEIFEETIMDSEIPSILKQHGFSIEEIMQGDHSLLEQPLPLLCADRIDYTLRDLYRYGYLSKLEIDRFIKKLCVSRGLICIEGTRQAEWFVEAYYKEVLDFFMNPLNVYGYDRLTKLLKEALELDVITLSDFKLTDEEVLQKVRTSNKSSLVARYEGLIKPVMLQENEIEFDIHLKGKPRLIDPTVIIEGKLVEGSNISHKIKEMNTKAKKRAEKGSYIKVL
ncbi:HD domain-containing protein [Bacillus sp. E(2018)]|uniref:HD domain-containing protein n=1 Tax=Bacillus sp. E(2018) TaxID=2502239 RepID=UPI0010F43BB4|nr:HD domain-containing protein [Bacillus sp. E(2018)]